MSAPELPELEPVRDDGVRALQVGLVLWVLAGLALLVARDELTERGTQWWLAVCAAGLLAGLVELAIFSRRRQLIRAREAQTVAADGGLGSPTDSGRAGPDAAGPIGAEPTG